MGKFSFWNVVIIFARPVYQNFLSTKLGIFSRKIENDDQFGPTILIFHTTKKSCVKITIILTPKMRNQTMGAIWTPQMGFQIHDSGGCFDWLLFKTVNVFVIIEAPIWNPSLVKCPVCKVDTKCNKKSNGCLEGITRNVTIESITQDYR